jgi:hypothetical protein
MNLSRLVSSSACGTWAWPSCSAVWPRANSLPGRLPGSKSPREAEYLFLSARKAETTSRATRLHAALTTNASGLYRP